MIVFNNWLISATGLFAMQYDNLSRSLDVVGDIPDGYKWEMLVEADEYKDTLAMRRTETGLSAVLTADNLSVAGMYGFQLRATLKADGVTQRHTNVVFAAVPASLTGDGNWPEIPTAYQQYRKDMITLASHPPIPGTNGHWLIWNLDFGVYEESSFPLPEGVAGGTTDHDKLSNRDAADQHPISAITGLEKTLSEKLPASELQNAVNAALEQAKASGEFDGADGQDGLPGKDGQDGSPGADGKDGKDGVSATHSWNGTVLTVTSASGTSSADLKGDKGDKGDTGAAGKDGATGADGKTPVKGTDYFTNADKQEIAEAAAELVDVPTTLPTPNKLTFTGAVNAQFDGSEAVTVNIPSGGGGSSSGGGVTRTVLLDVTTTEEVSSISGGALGEDGLATLLDADEVLFYLLQVPTADETVTTAGVTRLGIYKPSWYSWGLNLVSTYTIKTPIYGQAYNGQSFRLMTKIVDNLWRHEYMEATSATHANSAAGIFFEAFKNIDKTCYIQATTTTAFGVGTRLYVEAIKYTEG